MLLIDEARAEQLRKRIFLGLVGFGGAWGLSLLSHALELHGAPPFGALAIFLYAWAWVAWAEIWRAARADDWSPSAGDRDVVWFLLLFGPIAFISLFSLLVSFEQTASEAVPDRLAAVQEFARAFGDPHDEVALIYLGRRDLSGGNNPLDSDFRDILQFSFTDLAAGERLLRKAGLESTESRGSRYERNFHPRNFPLLWRPVSMSGNWISGDQAAPSLGSTKRT